MDNKKKYVKTYGLDELEAMFPYKEGCDCTFCHINKLALEVAICIEDEVGGSRGNRFVDDLAKIIEKY